MPLSVRERGKISEVTVRPLLIGFLLALAAAMGLSLLFSVTICLGTDPELRALSDVVSPLAGIAIGAYFAARLGSWRTGAWIGALYVGLWIGFWLYLTGRLNPLLWLEEGTRHLTFSHAVFWTLAILAGALGGWLGPRRKGGGLLFACVVGAGLTAFLTLGSSLPSFSEPRPGFQIQREGTAADGTTVFFLTFDFRKEPLLQVGLYDGDSDDLRPFDDANTSYLGQSLARLVRQLNHRAGASGQQLLAVMNGGFFGATGLSVARHEAPVVEEGHAHYNVDLLHPKDQAWLFAVQSPSQVEEGKPRFSMRPAILWGDLENYQTVLGGVRPLRVDGLSLPLKPGAGSTRLRCSRTSIGWSADGHQFHILIVHDPDGEASSQLQRKMNWPQTGGWDVREVQKFWEDRSIPFALLFDGGESTQLAFRQARGNFREIPSGYQYSFTLGHLHQRPLLFTLPILPPAEARRGVLNYLQITGPIRPATPL